MFTTQRDATREDYSLVGIGAGLNGLGSIPGRARIVSFLHSFQTVSRTHSGYWGLYTWGKVTRA
jgi:hypothetical protein